MAIIVVALAMWRTTPCIGTSLSRHGYLSISAFIGHLGYDPHLEKMPRRERFAGRVGYLDPTWADFAIHRLCQAKFFIVHRRGRLPCYRVDRRRRVVGLSEQCCRSNCDFGGSPGRWDRTCHYICTGVAGDRNIVGERMSAMIAFIVTLFLSARPASAHGSEVHLSHSIWTFDPWIVAPLAIAGTLYAVGGWRLWWRARESRQSILWRAAAYGIGWVTLIAALVSPVHWLGEHLFTFHMIEHEILMAVSAPMVVVARPIGVLMWGMPGRVRHRIGRMMKSRVGQASWEWMSRGTTVTTLHAIAIWAWHAPVLFDAAVNSVSLHRLQHLSFFATALLFWWSALWRSDRGVAAWHLFLTMLHTSILGALMALSPRVLYIAQTRVSEAWGLTPLEDQQLAGMVMWIPAGTIYAGAALTLLALWISTSHKGGGRDRRLSAL